MEKNKLTWTNTVKGRQTKWHEDVVYPSSKWTNENIIDQNQRILNSDLQDVWWLTTNLLLLESKLYRKCEEYFPQLCEIIRNQCTCYLVQKADDLDALYHRTTDDGRRTTDDGRRTTDDGRRTTDDGRRTTDDGRRTTDDGRRTTDDGRRTTDDGRRTTDDGRRCYIL